MSTRWVCCPPALDLAAASLSSPKRARACPALQLTSLLLLLLLALLVSACVDTADCDQATPCLSPQEQVCFQFRCVPRCAKDTLSCASPDQQCRACEDSCPGDEGFACVADPTR